MRPAGGHGPRPHSPPRARRASSSSQYSTREVVELRFRADEHEATWPAARRRWPTAVEVLPDRLLLYTDDGDGTLAEVHRLGVTARERPRAPVDPRGRVPPADRPHPGRLSRAAQPRGDRHRRRPVRCTARRGPARRRRRRRAGLGYWAYQYKRTWRGSVTTSFLYPVLYLAAMGLGLGSLVDQHAHAVDGGQLPRTSSRPGCWPPPPCRSGRTRRCTRSWRPSSGSAPTSPCWPRPLSVIDVLLGHLAWIGVAAGHGDDHLPGRHGRLRDACTRRWPCSPCRRPCSPGSPSPPPSPPSPPPRRTTPGFSTIYRLGLIPLFLFSGTFFPVSQLPGWLQAVADATPLYHGVALCRGLVSGHLGAGPAVGARRVPAGARASSASWRPSARTTGGWSRDRPAPVVDRSPAPRRRLRRCG